MIKMCAFGSLIVCTQIIIMTSIISHLLICLEKKSLRLKSLKKNQRKGLTQYCFLTHLTRQSQGRHSSEGLGGNMKRMKQ